MSYSPASVQSPTIPAQQSWTTASLVLLLAALLALLAIAVGRRVDTGRHVAGVTTARTAAAPVLAVSLAGTDLGGVTGQRSGDQP